MIKPALLGLFLTFYVGFQAQNTKTYRQMVEIRDLPKIVQAEFKLRYPDAFVKMWYTTHIPYWYQDYGPSYYNGWYQPRTVVIYRFDQPAYFEVEFLNQDENSRAIFNRQ